MTDSPVKKKQSARFCKLDEEHAGQRLDNYLMFECKSLPRTLIYRLIRKGEVRVNKKRSKPSQRLNLGDLVRIPLCYLKDDKKPYGPPVGVLAQLESSILYEDTHLMVLNKPAGLAVHGGSGLNFGLIEALRQSRPNEKRLELVHRLDRDTSGCIMVAKKRQALIALHRCLREKQVIRKEYHALVLGRWPQQVKCIDAPLSKNQLASGERIARVDVSGKEALTKFKCLKYYPSVNLSLMQAFPITGRTHQIRVHAMHADYPIAGDSKYCPESFAGRTSVKFSRLFLHAYKLTLRHPVTGEHLSVIAPYADDWQELMTSLVLSGGEKGQLC